MASALALNTTEELYKYIWTDEPGQNEAVSSSSFEEEEEAYSFSARHVALAVIPHITAILSLLGSSLIIVDVCRHRRKIGSVYHRLLLGLAISDIIASIGFFLSTWPIPQDSMSASWGALGTVQTCEFQGFLIQLGLATPLYNTALSIYYVLLVRFNWKPKSREMRRMEYVSHAVAILLALGTAWASLVLKLYNNANLWCWIAPYPYDCVNSIAADDGVGTCIRGDNAWVYRMAFYFSWLWASFGVVTVCMGVMVRTVYRQSQKMDRYRQAGESRNAARWARVQSVAVQSSLYILAFIVTALPVSVARILQAKYNCTSTYFPLSLTTVLFFPTQGFWNAIIYFRPRYLRYLEQRKKSSTATTSTTSAAPGSSAFFTKLFQHNKNSRRNSSKTASFNSTEASTALFGSSHTTLRASTTVRQYDDTTETAAAEPSEHHHPATSTVPPLTVDNGTVPPTDDPEAAAAAATEQVVAAASEEENPHRIPRDANAEGKQSPRSLMKEQASNDGVA